MILRLNIFKKILSSFSFVLLCIPSVAIDIKGLVVSASDQPLPYASIYLKGDPSVCTVTDNNGRFQLVVDYDKYYRDSLIISFIGYKDSRNSVYNLNGWITQSGPTAIMKFKLEDDPIQIPEASITVKKGRKKNGEIENILRLVSQKLEEDFPRGEVRRYKIKIDSYLKNKKTMMGVQQDVGIVTETPDTSELGWKVAFDTLEHKTFVDPVIRHYLDSIQAEQASKHPEASKDTVKAKDSDKRGVSIGANGIEGIEYTWPDWLLLKFDEVIENPGDWVLNKLSDEEYLLHLNGRKRFYLIAKAEFDVTLRVNAKDYSVKSYYMNVRLHMSIPFGVKIGKKDVEEMNTLLGTDLEKFKMKKIDAHVEHSAFFVRRNGKLVPTNKTYTAVGGAYDRRDNGFELNAAVKMSTLQAL
jgi:hypothetical protein